MESNRKEIHSTSGSELDGMKIALCITGSVASMEIPRLARELMRHGADVVPVVSKAAKRLIQPELLEWATGNQVISRLTSKLEHVKLGGGGDGSAEIILIAPCTANTLSKIALGVSDTTVTALASVALGSGVPIIVAPGMHEPMYSNPAVKSAIDQLRSIGVTIMDPILEEGKAKLTSIDGIIQKVIESVVPQDMRNVETIVTAGPTIEQIDPVRVISNRSSGKMGIALAEEAQRRGASVTLIYGPGYAEIPSNILTIRVNTAKEMFNVAENELSTRRIGLFIAAAAPSDYSVKEESVKKISSNTRESLNVELVSTKKIVEMVKVSSNRTKLITFKASYSQSETESVHDVVDLFERSQADMVVLNDVSKNGIGFGSDYNEVTIFLTPDKYLEVPKSPKSQIAKRIIDALIEQDGGE